MTKYLLKCLISSSREFYAKKFFTGIYRHSLTVSEKTFLGSETAQLSKLMAWDTGPTSIVNKACRRYQLPYSTVQNWMKKVQRGQPIVNTIGRPMSVDKIAIQIKMEMTISQYYQDVYKERTSLVYPDISMRTPKYCATLLKKYLHEEIKKAKGLASMNNWERHPHSRFYAREGTFQKVNFSRKTLPPPKAAAQVTANHSQSNENGTCIWNLGSLIKATASNGQLIVCRNGTKCLMKHVQLKEIKKTKKNKKNKTKKTKKTGLARASLWMTD